MKLSIRILLKPAKSTQNAEGNAQATLCYGRGVNWLIDLCIAWARVVSDYNAYYSALRASPLVEFCAALRAFAAVDDIATAVRKHAPGLAAGVPCRPPPQIAKTYFTSFLPAARSMARS